jgi:hypothetical protein
MRRQRARPAEVARRAAGAGYDTVLFPDHTGMIAPMPAMVAAAAAADGSSPDSRRHPDPATHTSPRRASPTASTTYGVRPVRFADVETVFDDRSPGFDVVVARLAGRT